MNRCAAKRNSAADFIQILSSSRTPACVPIGRRGIRAGRQKALIVP
jgi:hypothetical protein